MSNTILNGSPVFYLKQDPNDPLKWTRSVDKQIWQTINSYPVVIQNNGSTQLFFESELNISSSNHYIEILSNDVIIDGNNHKIKTNNNLTIVKGLIKNGYFNSGLDFRSGANNVQIRNMKYYGSADISTFDGFVFQKYFGYGSKDILVEYIENYADINSFNSGGIAGSFFGVQAEEVRLINCKNFGKINGQNSGGIAGSSFLLNGFIAEVSNCVNAGEITSNGIGAGGIFGSEAFRGYAGVSKERFAFITTENQNILLATEENTSSTTTTRTTRPRVPPRTTTQHKRKVPQPIFVTTHPPPPKPPVKNPYRPPITKSSLNSESTKSTESMESTEENYNIPVIQCANLGNIFGEGSGGIFGISGFHSLQSSLANFSLYVPNIKVLFLYNVGDIYGLYAGGIFGKDSFNNSYSPNFNIEYSYFDGTIENDDCGGIFGANYFNSNSSKKCILNVNNIYSLPSYYNISQKGSFFGSNALPLSPAHANRILNFFNNYTVSSNLHFFPEGKEPWFLKLNQNNIHDLSWNRDNAHTTIGMSCNDKNNYGNGTFEFPWTDKSSINAFGRPFNSSYEPFILTIYNESSYFENEKYKVNPGFTSINVINGSSNFYGSLPRGLYHVVNSNLSKINDVSVYSEVGSINMNSGQISLSPDVDNQKDGYIIVYQNNLLNYNDNSGQTGNTGVSGNSGDSGNQGLITYNYNYYNIMRINVEVLRVENTYYISQDTPESNKWLLRTNKFSVPQEIKSFPLKIDKKGFNVEFETNLRVTSSSQYIEILNEDITVDGKDYGVSLDSISYDGLIKNGSASTRGYSGITVKNIKMYPFQTNVPRLNNRAGYILQSFFGKDSSNNTVKNLKNYINILGTTNASENGGIGGSNVAQGATNFVAEDLENFGKISTLNSGGIFGRHFMFVAKSGGVKNAINRGQIETQFCGGIFGSWAFRFFSGQGNISLTINSNQEKVVVHNCENHGQIMTRSSQSGGIFGALAFAGLGAFLSESLVISQCKNYGNILSASCGGIFSDISFDSANRDVLLFECENIASLLSGSLNSGGILGSNAFRNANSSKSFIVQNCKFDGQLQSASQGGMIGNVINKYNTSVRIQIKNPTIIVRNTSNQIVNPPQPTNRIHPNISGKNVTVLIL